MGRLGRIGVVLGVCTAIAATGAASASATKLVRLKANGAVLAAGAPIEATGSVTLTRNFIVGCPDSKLIGTATKPGGLKAAAVQITEAKFQGELEEGACSSTFTEEPLKEKVKVKVKGAPWPEEFQSTGLAYFKRRMEVEIKPVHNTLPHPVQCLFGSGTPGISKGHFPLNGEPLTVTFTEQTFHWLSGSSERCGGILAAKATLTLSYTSGGFPIVASYE